MELFLSLDKKLLCYFSYKLRIIMKVLIGIILNGVVFFISELYCGLISDLDIVKSLGYF